MIQQYCLGFAFSDDKKRVLLIRKNRPEWMNGFLNGIGGKLEHLEAPIKGMVREFNEETGLLTEEHIWKHFCTMRTGSDSIYCFFSVGLDIYLARHMNNETEVPEVCLVSYIGGNRYRYLSNLSWLIPLALDDGQKYGEPVFSEIIYKPQ